MGLSGTGCPYHPLLLHTLCGCRRPYVACVRGGRRCRVDDPAHVAKFGEPRTPAFCLASPTPQLRLAPPPGEALHLLRLAFNLSNTLAGGAKYRHCKRSEPIEIIINVGTVTTFIVHYNIMGKIVYCVMRKCLTDQSTKNHKRHRTAPKSKKVKPEKEKGKKKPTKSNGTTPCLFCRI